MGTKAGLLRKLLAVENAGINFEHVMAGAVGRDPKFHEAKRANARDRFIKAVWALREAIMALEIV